MIELENLPDHDTYLKLLGFTFEKESSMAQGTKTLLTYKKVGFTVNLWVDHSEDNMNFLEGVKINRENV